MLDGFGFFGFLVLYNIRSQNLKKNYSTVRVAFRRQKQSFLDGTMIAHIYCTVSTVCQELKKIAVQLLIKLKAKSAALAKEQEDGDEIRERYRALKKSEEDWLLHPPFTVQVILYVQYCTVSVSKQISQHQYTVLYIPYILYILYCMFSFHPICTSKIIQFNVLVQ